MLVTSIVAHPDPEVHSEQAQLPPGGVAPLAERERSFSGGSWCILRVAGCTLAAVR